MNRREFLAVAATSMAAASLPAAAPPPTLWKGFNLLEKFDANKNRPFLEWDFRVMKAWGFNFVRLPMSYLCWTTKDDWTKVDERRLEDVDQAIGWGKQYGVHVNLNFHRAPGYCVNPPKEPRNLFVDGDALDACAHHWAVFARRYRSIPNSELSFNLLNEPGADVTEAAYAKVVRRLVGAIREVTPDRRVFIDGMKWATEPVMSVADLELVQSTRGYAPMQVSHYQASWIGGSDKWAVPTWPLTHDKQTWDKERMKRKYLAFQPLRDRGHLVHVGEWGAHNRTPHDVVLAWMTDLLDVWKELGLGYSLWNLRGSFGVFDSGRKDVAYETFEGRKLDRKMIDLLRRY
jgi:endoglucanase